MKPKRLMFFFLLSISICESITPCAQTNPQDSLALVALYDSTDGQNWIDNANWLTTEPVAAWKGISVTLSRVTTIYLGGNGLHGSIPPQLGNLSSLISLVLETNELSGSIPRELGKLSNLQYLYLDNNQLSGGIPPELGNLLNLQYLYMPYNKLSSIPPELGNLSNLRILYLDNNQLTGSIPPELGKLSNLYDLWLNNNQLSGIIPPELGNLLSLHTLSLNDNQLSGGIPRELGNLSNLQYLYVQRNQLASIIPPELGRLSNLRYLLLYNNQLDGSIPPELGELLNLFDLLLGNNQLTGNIPPELGKLSNLNDLWLNNNQLAGNIPPELGNLLSLHTLSLNDNQLSGGIPPDLGNLSNLELLYLHNNQFTGSIAPELGRLSSLRYLVLYNNQLAGSIPPELGELSNLVALYLEKNQLSGSIPPELGKLSGLNVLNFDYNELSGPIPAGFGNVISEYGEMNLSHDRFTFAGMEDLVQKRPNTIYYRQADIQIHFLNDSELYVSAGGTVSDNNYKWFKVGSTDSFDIAGDSVFHPLEDGKYYAAVTNSICTQLTLHTDTVGFTSAMPVTLIHLKAQREGKLVKITWTSVNETNIARYEIQRSLNAISFISIGSRSANGNGTAQYDYSFNDVQPQLGINYYRLKIVDQDGERSYTIIISVTINGNAITVVYPVPVKDVLHIQTNRIASFSLIDQSGKIVLRTNINESGTINVSGIAAGLYLLKNNATSEIQKIMVMR